MYFLSRVSILPRVPSLLRSFLLKSKDPRERRSTRRDFLFSLINKMLPFISCLSSVPGFEPRSRNDRWRLFPPCFSNAISIYCQNIKDYAGGCREGKAEQISGVTLNNADTSRKLSRSTAPRVHTHSLVERNKCKQTNNKSKTNPQGGLDCRRSRFLATRIPSRAKILLA